MNTKGGFWSDITVFFLSFRNMTTTLPGTGDNNTFVLKYKLLYSKCLNGCVNERERERWKTAMIDTIWSQTYSEPYFFFDKGFDIEPVLSQETTCPTPIQADISTHWLLSK